MGGYVGEMGGYIGEIAEKSGYVGKNGDQVSEWMARLEGKFINGRNCKGMAETSFSA
jgi:hypothetical protein